MTLIDTTEAAASRPRSDSILRQIDLIEPKASYNYEKLVEYCKGTLTDLTLQL